MICFKSAIMWTWRRYKLLSCLLLTVSLVIYLIEITYFQAIKRKEEEEKALPIEPIEPFVFEGERLIHFDLKGAPPKLSYLLSLFPLMKNLGATGILMEYEDMFPYHSELEGIPALNAYTRSDIATIIETARKENLDVIPLIPTFGHFEFVLKLEQYKKYREMRGYPQVLCPSQPEVFSLLKKMIDQVMEAHNTTKYIHIGCDEVEILGHCSVCQNEQIKNKWRKDGLYLDHVQRLAQYINKTYPGVRPIVWGDKFQSTNEKIAPALADLIDIMFWNYSPKKSYFPGELYMNDFVQTFQNVWIASAFKGATGRAQIATDIEYHLENVQGWMEFVQEWKTKINFRGIVMTGWQRYNHFSVLCELLPVGVPSMALTLQFLTNNGTHLEKAKEYLNCTDFVPVGLDEMLDFKKFSKLKCGFPGFDIYYKINHYHTELKNFQSALWTFWSNDFTFYNVHDWGPSIQRAKKGTYKRHLLKLNELENEIKVALATVFDQYTISEWITTHVTPVRILLQGALITTDKLREIDAWSRRPEICNKMLQTEKLFNSVCNSNETTGCTLLNFYH